MSTLDPIRAALERLVELNEGCTADHWHAAILAARAALLEQLAPTAEVPEQLGGLTMWVRAEETFIDSAGKTYLRDLSGHGRHLAVLDATPDAGEAEELVEWLEGHAEDCTELGRLDWAKFSRRAAALLEQLSTAQPERLRRCPTHGQQPATAWGCPECVRELREQLSSTPPAPKPVAVSERPWRQAGWCDSFGRCWMGDPGGQGFIPSWRFCRPEDAPSMSVSLPFNALPLPATTPAGQEGK